MLDAGLPRELGSYRLLERLGAGGMGEVFLAERVGEGGFRRRCCVKTVLPRLSARPEIATMFEREAVLAARVVHENVVQVFDFGRAEGMLFLAMEYVDGLTARALADELWRRGERVSVETACSILSDVARGLAAVHGLSGDDGEPLDLVHRDVTPDNILLTRDGLAKLGDFGIAFSKNSARVTETGVIKGKLPYLAPEVIEGEAVGQASDLFSLGVSMFHLLAGRRPFDRGTEFGTMTAIVQEEAPLLSTLRADVPAELASLIARLLAKDPRRRPASARAVVDELAALAPLQMVRPAVLVEGARPREAASRTAETIALPTLDALPSRRRRARAIAVGAALAAAVATVGYVLLPAPSSGSQLGSMVSQASTQGPPAPASIAPPTPAAAAPRSPSPAPSPSSSPSPSPPSSSPSSSPPVAAERPKSAAPLVSLVGPPEVRWSTSGGRALGSGETQARVADRAVVALHVGTGGRSVVPIVGGAARYDALAKGRLEVRANPFADVHVGQRAFGTTPITPPPELPVGKYRVRLRYEGKERSFDVDMKPGETTSLRVDMNEGGAP